MKTKFRILLGAALVCAAIVVTLELRAPNQRVADAQAQVDRWAERLQSQTTEAGILIRHPANQLPETDPWGTPLSVTYAQGGFAETLTVRSAGPDQIRYTQDDIMAQRSVLNLKGIGKGAKDNVEEFTHHSARGLIKGAAEGIKETVQGAIAEKSPIAQKK